VVLCSFRLELYCCGSVISSYTCLLSIRCAPTHDSMSLFVVTSGILEGNGVSCGEVEGSCRPGGIRVLLSLIQRLCWAPPAVLWLQIQQVDRSDARNGSKLSFAMDRPSFLSFLCVLPTHTRVHAHHLPSLVWYSVHVF
jgi:hypothetical protein